ncbi:choice-of-anchor E domain-containing protein [Rhodovibrio sodomensis]|uniref:choice-of-anchor E domain-containing protein n=1 Tax=Rhodovibrio sodomensis TaxID=1088 RepID=UPI00190528AE|nr:choice-of-anchor E domain-containing protein [Rhodovibrio sodomensis]
MKRALRALGTAAAVATLVGAGSANAAILGTASDSVGFSETELDNTLSVGPFSGTGVTSIDITLTGLIDTSITLTNDAAQEQEGSAEAQSDFTFTSSEISPASLGLAASTGSITLSSGQTDTFAASDSGATSQSVSGGLAALLDGFAVDVTTDTALLIDFGGGNVTGTQDTEARAVLNVTYNGETTTVPAPGTLALLGAALLGLGVFGRRYNVV